MMSERTNTGAAGTARAVEPQLDVKAVEEIFDPVRYLATAAHDLDSSVLVVAKNAELLRDAAGPALSPEQEDHLARIERACARMGRLLDAVRNLARVSASECRPVQLQDVLEEALEMVADLIAGRGAEVVVEGELPAVIGDRDQLVRLFQNLLSNALKFGPHGGRVAVSTSPGDGAWLIAVSDQGPGVAPANRERIFEPFWRSQETGHVPGTGLGLTICRSVARNHGGSLTVESAPGGGARFVFRIPQRQLAPVA